MIKMVCYCIHCKSTGKTFACAKCGRITIRVPSKCTNVKPLTKKFLTAKDVSTMKRSTKAIPGFEFLSSVPKKFSIVLWGPEGSGKSTLAMKFAKAVSLNDKKVLYICAEEGADSETIKKRLDLVDAKSENIILVHEQDKSKIMAAIKEINPFHVIIDSASVVNIKTQDLAGLKKSCPGIICFILHATKSGIYKGSRDLPHDCDIVVRVTHGVAKTTKNRLGELKSQKIFPKKQAVTHSVFSNASLELV